jgi:hypothetical protein
MATNTVTVRENRARPGPNPAHPEEKYRVVPPDQTLPYDVRVFPFTF